MNIDMDWRLIPGPEMVVKPAAPEWDGSDMVKAGHRLYARVDNNPWLSGCIAYRSEDGVVFKPDDGGDELFWGFNCLDVQFRPIREQAERNRQRDDLISEIKADLDALSVEHSKNLAAGLAIGMINRGWRKEAEK